MVVDSILLLFIDINLVGFLMLVVSFILVFFIFLYCRLGEILLNNDNDKVFLIICVYDESFFVGFLFILVF